MTVRLTTFCYSAAVQGNGDLLQAVRDFIASQCVDSCGRLSQTRMEAFEEWLKSSSRSRIEEWTGSQVREITVLITRHNDVRTALRNLSRFGWL